MAVRLRAEPLGEASVLLTAHGGDAEARWTAVLLLHRRIGAAPPPGVVDRIHAAESLLLVLDPLAADAATVANALLDVEALGPMPAPRRFVLPVRLDGPDLDDVLAATRLDREGLTRVLCGQDLVVRALGVHALPLLEPTADRVAVARLRSPRARVPAGAVGLAGDRVCVYPVAAPGGWRLIGTTPLALVDPGADPIAPYAPGDRFVLRSVGAGESEALAGRPLEAEPWTSG